MSCCRKKSKGSGIAIVDLFLMIVQSKKNWHFGGVKSSRYHDSKNNISIIDHLREATTNCRLESKCLPGNPQGRQIIFSSFWKVKY